MRFRTESGAPSRLERRAIRWRAIPLLRVLLAAILGLGGGGSARAAAADPAAFADPIVVTEVPVTSAAPAASDAASDFARSASFDGARLVLAAPEGTVRVLSEGFQSACDPNVSFDGRRILFSGRKARSERWRIWEIGLDGQGLRPVSHENLDARSPLYVSTLFTLDSPQPWFTAVFVGRESFPDESGRATVTSLYNVKLDGGELRRLTYNPNRSLDPTQMWDGRVIYAAERQPSDPLPAGARSGLFAIHIEGADMELYGGERGRRFQAMPCATAGGLMVFVETDQPASDGSGQLACVEQRRPHLTYRPLTQEAAFVYRYPSALQGNRVLVARRSSGITPPGRSAGSTPIRAGASRFSHPRVFTPCRPYAPCRTTVRTVTPRW